MLHKNINEQFSDMNESSYYFMHMNLVKLLHL